MKKVIHDIHPDICPQSIANRIMEQVNAKCIQYCGEKFEFDFDQGWYNLHFVEEYWKVKKFFGERWEECPSSHSEQNRIQLSKFQAAIKMLPHNIYAELVIESIDDERDRACPPVIARKVTTYAIRVFVPEEYSSTKYNGRIIRTGLIHAKVSDTFMCSAKQFREKLIEQHSDLIQKFVSLADSYTNGSFYVQLDGIAVYDIDTYVLYSRFKMKPLSTWEQAYGLAWCIAEKLQMCRGDRIEYCELGRDEYCISVFFKEREDTHSLCEW